MGAKIQLLFTIKKQNIYYFDRSKTKKTKATFVLSQTNTTKKSSLQLCNEDFVISFS